MWARVDEGGREAGRGFPWGLDLKVRRPSKSGPVVRNLQPNDWRAGPFDPSPVGTQL